MPHELFCDVVARPQSVRSRRSPLVVASLALHGALVAGFVVTSVVAPEALPFPDSSLCFCADIHLVTLPPPEPPVQSRMTAATHPASAMPAAELPVVPLTAPDGVSPEPGVEAPDSSVGGGSGGSAGDATPSIPIAGAGLPEPVEPPPTASTGPIRLHSGIRAPRKVVDVAPAYPTLARDAHVQGTVIIEATIGADGLVQSARVLRSITLLDDAALAAVRQWRFEPARLNDQPVAVIMTITVQFTLGR